MQTVVSPQPQRHSPKQSFFEVPAPWWKHRIDQFALTAALSVVPLSIAASETLLAIALCARLLRLARWQDRLIVPLACSYWLPWAALEIVVWLHSPRPGAGKGEMRHLLLIGALFVTLPCLASVPEKVRVWRLIFVTATFGSAVLVIGFFARAIRYRHELAMGGDAAFYLRSGGLLHHWMVYATVEILVVGALLEFRSVYVEERRWLTPALVVHCLAIVLSLTRSLWLASLIVFGLHLAWRRSKWFWVLPLLPVFVFLLVPGPIHQRMTESLLPDYYSNQERVEMWRVGWRMIREHPIAGIGPGLVEEQYTHYLRPGEPVPAYHGHLHSNPMQLAAQFGLVVLGASILFLAVLVRDLLRSWRGAQTRDEQVLCRSGLLGVAGFLMVGLMDYTYGHSLGLILLSFVVIAPPGLARRHKPPHGIAWP
ncbi:MAG TPA: O-antigen ligase family protein [Bryobacteraceae bacterium]|jgi:O-antigen ligase